jgi:hypothetical protein
VRSWILRRTGFDALWGLGWTHSFCIEMFRLSLVSGVSVGIGWDYMAFLVCFSICIVHGDFFDTTRKAGD